MIVKDKIFILSIKNQSYALVRDTVEYIYLIIIKEGRVIESIGKHWVKGMQSRSTHEVA